MLGRSSGLLCVLCAGALACSSGGGGGGGGASASGGQAGASSGGTGGSVGPDAGLGGSTAGTGGASAGSGGVAGSGGADAGAPLPTDVAESAACKSWCAKLDAACGQPKCDPKTDCKIPAGQCAASTEAFLQCQASTGSFSCGSGGHTILHNCKKDPSSCPPGTIVGQSCEGHCGGKAPSGCFCEASCKQYNDCCSDFDAKCGGGTGGGGSTGPHAVPKTCAEANNGKGCCGWGTGPNDTIAYQCSGGSVVAQKCGFIGCVVSSDGTAACGDGSELPSLPNCFQN